MSQKRNIGTGQHGENHKAVKFSEISRQHSIDFLFALCSSLQQHPLHPVDIDFTEHEAASVLLLEWLFAHGVTGVNLYTTMELFS